MEISTKHNGWIQPNFKRKNQLHGCPKKFGSMICMEEQCLPTVPNNDSEIHQRRKGGFRMRQAIDVRERHRESLPNLPMRCHRTPPLQQHRRPQQPLCPPA
ncbi:hypothetical protein ACFX13_012613 [Malus domestica]